MAAGGGGVTLLPSVAVELENRRHALQVRPFAAKALGTYAGAVWRKLSALGLSARDRETLRPGTHAWPSASRQTR